MAEYRAFISEPRWSPGWLPVFANGGGDFYGVDLGPEGVVAVRHFWFDEAEHPIEFSSLSAIMATLAQDLGLGLIEVRKDPARSADSDRLWQRTTPPDYEDRHLTLGFRRNLINSGDRALLVDDWIETGAQALACRGVVADAGATWLGISVIVDALELPELRRPLKLRSILHVREL